MSIIVALARGIITTFYPNFIGQNPSFMYQSTILGMMHHTWSEIVVILMFMFGYLNLTYKKMVLYINWFYGISLIWSIFNVCVRI